MLSLMQLDIPTAPIIPFREIPTDLAASRTTALREAMAGDKRERRNARKKLRIANFVTFSGSPGIWGPAATNSALLAASEINERGGILGREIEIVLFDAGGPIEDVVRRAEDAVSFDDIDLVMGSHISAVRVVLRKALKGSVPYIYTPVYEGGERTPGVVAIGETPRRQSRPAIDWLASTKKASRWYLIGSDYVWPWLSHRAVKRYIADCGGQIVGEEFVPMGQDNHEAHLARIRAAKPDVVLISLIGTDSITFNRSFAESGLAAKMLRLAGAMDETVLLGIGADNTENLFCASGYFGCLGSVDNERFLDRYRSAFGSLAPPIGSVGQSNYEGLCFLEAAARRAESLAMKPLLSATAKLIYSGARGPIAFRQGHAEMPIYLAEADGLEFRILQKF